MSTEAKDAYMIAERHLGKRNVESGMAETQAQAAPASTHGVAFWLLVILKKIERFVGFEKSQQGGDLQKI